MFKIPDPIHGYISLEGMYADIVDTPQFQRLRHVEQVNFHPSYPAARHERFTHSLGTYHLATIFVERFFENLEKDAGIIPNPDLKRTLTTTFRYAALLHDIGHAPFSHTTEKLFLEPKAHSGLPQVWDDLCVAVGTISSGEGTLFRQAPKEVGAAHEITSALLLVEDLNTLLPDRPRSVSRAPRQNRKKQEKEYINLPLAARMVIGFTYEPEDKDAFAAGDPLAPADTEELGIRNCLIQLMNSSILDVDRLDYLGRDAHMTGFRNAPVDLNILSDSVTAVKQECCARIIAQKETAVKLPIGTDIRLHNGTRITLTQEAEVILPKGAILPIPADAQVQNPVKTPARNVNQLGENSTLLLPDAETGIALPCGVPLKLPSGTTATQSDGSAVSYPDCTTIRIPGGSTAALPPSAVLSCPNALHRVYPQDWLLAAYRDGALRVFDLMFQAKLSHDAWVVASPAGPYDAALRLHCIRQLNQIIHPKYLEKVFSPDALRIRGVQVPHRRKHYRLLNDLDIFADLREQHGDLFDELFTRKQGRHRTAAWRSYYEFHHYFDAPQIGVTPEKVYAFFKPLLKHLDKYHFFVFDADAYTHVSEKGDADALRAADFLRDFLMANVPNKTKPEKYNAVLLERTNNFTMKVDPEQVRIVFSKQSIALRADGKNYSSYAQLAGVYKDDNRAAPYFYLYRYGGLGRQQMADLRDALAKEFKKP